MNLSISEENGIGFIKVAAVVFFLLLLLRAWFASVLAQLQASRV